MKARVPSSVSKALPWSSRLFLLPSLLYTIFCSPLIMLATTVSLRNSTCEAHFTYEDGIRLASFRLLGEENVLRESAAATRGLKTWIMVPSDLVGVRDSLSEEPAEVEELSPGSLRLWTPEANERGLRLEWLVSLHEEEAKLTITHRVYLDAGPPRHLSVWLLAAVDTETVITAPFPDSSALPESYPVPIHFFRMTSLGDARLSLIDDAVQVDLTETGHDHMKFGLVQPAGVLFAQRHGTRARFHAAYDPLGTYPEGGSNVTVYASPTNEGRGIGEVEHMSPLFLLKPGEFVELVQEISLERVGGTD